MEQRKDHAPPANWQDFEDLCLKLWRLRLVDAKKNGRSGQPQAGVDIFGRDPKTEAWVGIQCKQRGQWPKKVLTVSEIGAEVEQAEGFEPPLSHFIVATTAPRDVEVQRFVRELSDGRQAEGKFSVDLFAWDDLQDWFQEGPEAMARKGLPVVPPAIRDFAGRADELEELCRAVGEHGGALIYGVRGLGGIGKTELGLKLVEMIGNEYPDGHILVELGGASDHPLSSADAMAQVIRAYEPQLRLPEAKEDLRRMYHQALKDRRTIVLLDDAASAGQVEPILPHAGCLTLVTSRHRFALPKLHRLDLDVLTQQAARELLLSLAPRLSTQAGRIAKLLGRLPMALRLAGSAFAERPDLEPEEYVLKLESRSERVGLVEAAITFNYEALEPELQQQWRALAVFPGDFDVAAAAAVWAMETDAAKNILGGSLYPVSLVEWRSRRFHLHDLARDFAISRIEENERRTADRRHAAHYIEVLREANRLYKEGGDFTLMSLALFDAEYGNIQAGQAWAAIHAGQDRKAAEQCSAYPDASAYCLSLRLHPEDWILWLKCAHSAAESLGDRQRAGAHLGNLGNAYTVKGETRQAVEYFEQALVIARELGERRNEGVSLGNLGRCYARLGEIRRAVGYFQQALTIARELNDQRDESGALGNLANAYYSLGDIEGTIAYSVQKLNIALEARHWESAIGALTTLCNCHLDKRDLDKAIYCGESALKISQSIGDRLGEGNAVGNLGNAYYQGGEIKKAISYYKQQLAIVREIGDRIGEGNALGNLGLAYAARKQFKRSIAAHERALAINREIGHRRAEGNALCGLGVAYASCGEGDRARAFLKQALKIGREIQDPRIVSGCSKWLDRLRTS